MKQKYYVFGESYQIMYVIQGNLVSETAPRDSSGEGMRNVHSIAAGKGGSHLAMINADQQKVVITDLYGKCKG